MVLAAPVPIFTPPPEDPESGPTPPKVRSMCVFITAGPSTKLFACVGGGILEDMCYDTRDDEPRPVWTSLSITNQ